MADVVVAKSVAYKRRLGLGPLEAARFGEWYSVLRSACQSSAGLANPRSKDAPGGPERRQEAVCKYICARPALWPVGPGVKWEGVGIWDGGKVAAQEELVFLSRSPEFSCLEHGSSIPVSASVDRTRPVSPVTFAPVSGVHSCRHKLAPLLNIPLWEVILDSFLRHAPCTPHQQVP